MQPIMVRDMQPDDEYFVGTCSHVNESAEIDACGRRRLAWLRRTHEAGVRAKVARLDGEPVGFAYVMPIEVSPWGPLGRDLMVLDCLWVLPRAQHHGAGHALVQAAEEEARRQRRKALVTQAYYHDFWFMPAVFFTGHDAAGTPRLGSGQAEVGRCGSAGASPSQTAGGDVGRCPTSGTETGRYRACGFTRVAQRGKAAILWKVFDASAEPPTFLESRYRYQPAPGKVVIDLFFNTFCETSDIEAQPVREAAAEFGDAVVLHEYPADDRDVLLKHQTPRAIFVNGREIGWGYEAPKDGIRAAIQEALRAEPRP
jgi:GNAT superfamily N-acetyltransferase